MKLLKYLSEGSRHGLERECLRVTSRGYLSDAVHPKALGSSLTHPYISTDFSESQLELITPHFADEKAALGFLAKLHRYICPRIGSEFLWPFSVPCKLPGDPAIQIATFGHSLQGLERWIYRRGLYHRYGPKMQCMSGVHYNFSFSNAALEAYGRSIGDTRDFKEFRSEFYLALMRCFFQVAWINSYLFGATPAVDASYLGEPSRILEKWGGDTLVAPYGTSLRMSSLGYYSKVQQQIGVSYQNLDAYLDSLTYATTVEAERFAALGESRDGERIQLNTNYLQVPAEHYSRIRPKCSKQNGMPTLQALSAEGIDYIEVRMPDLDPFEKDGISLGELRFLHCMLLTCAGRKENELNPAEALENQESVALYGRKKGLSLKKDGKETSLREWALEILQEMEEAAAALGPVYVKLIKKQREKVLQPDLTPSARLLQEISLVGGVQALGCLLGAKHQAQRLEEKVDSTFEARLERLTPRSLKKQEALEDADDKGFRGYEDLEISTQILLKEAWRRGIPFDILDRHDNFVRFRSLGKSLYVKQATLSEQENLISYFLMENKWVSKQILKEKGINVPLGQMFSTKDDALECYPAFSERFLVVKPVFTNFGHGISFVAPRDETAFSEAVNQAFSFGKEVIVEDAVPGDEYRFLVVRSKVVAVCMRLPARVIGDGKSSIRELAIEKNKRRLSTYPIKLGKTEKAELGALGLSVDTVLPKGKEVFLRHNSNVSTGGDSIDATDRVAPSYGQVAVQAADLVGATFCGVDMMIVDPTLRADRDNHSIIELNFNPALYLHRYPESGQVRYVERDVLDALVPLAGCR